MSLPDSIILDINGVPGSGKSLLSVVIAQAKVSAWRQELIQMNELIESKHADYNFNKLKQLCINQWFKQKIFTENELFKEIQALKLTTGLTPHEDLSNLEIIDFYQVQFDYYNNLNNFFNARFELEYYYNYYLTFIRPMIISNMPIYDKQNGRCSVIADMKWFKQAFNNNILVEPYTILILDEIDKEWNTFSSVKQEIIKGGIVSTIQMWRHLTKNRGVFIMCYQIESSLLYQIRANAENQIKLYKHKKDTMCSIPYLVLDRVNVIFLRFDLWLFNTYMNKKIKIKDMSAEINLLPKRYRLTAHKMLFTKLINFNVSILRFFNKYTVFKLFAQIINSGDIKKPKKKQLKVNLFDIANTYNNTFFFPEHTKKLLNQKDKLLFRERWQTINPNLSELKNVDSSFYDSFFNIVRPKPKKKKEDKEKKA